MGKKNKGRILSSSPTSQKKKVELLVAAEKKLSGMSIQEKAAFFEKTFLASQKELAYTLIAES